MNVGIPIMYWRKRRDSETEREEERERERGREREREREMTKGYLVETWFQCVGPEALVSIVNILHVSKHIVVTILHTHETQHTLIAIAGKQMLRNCCHSN